MGGSACEDVRGQKDQGLEPGAPQHGAGTPDQGTVPRAPVWARGSNGVPPGTRGDARAARSEQQSTEPGTALLGAGLGP